MNINYILLMIFSVLISAFAQILLKLSSNKKFRKRFEEYLNWNVISAYAIFLVSTILTAIAYKGVFLKAGPVIESTGFIFILLLGRLFLGESITNKKVWGIFLIIIGIIVFSYR